MRARCRWVLGAEGERILAVRAALGNERVDIVQWHAEPLHYIAGALGLNYLPSAFLRPASRRADILLGDIDYRAALGRRHLNMLLTSALTGWRVRVQPIARSRSWRPLQAAQDQHRSVVADVVGRAPRGLRVRVYGLNALLPFGQ
ncbi:MAG: hypothetical protein JOY61_11570, partial [Chloroflexi bacterium]|nr:hypothetical protein [Chloroflexota bacterium]